MDYFDLKLISHKNKKFSDVTKDIFDYVRMHHSPLGRVSITTLENNQLSTYHSEDINDNGNDHLEFKSVSLNLDMSLWKIIHTKTYRIVDDINLISQTPQITRLIQAGYVSSMTVPIVFRDKVAGIIFFNSKKPGYFTDKNIEKDFIYLAQVLSSKYIQELERRNNFKKLLQVALKISHHRDPETAQHLIRMGKYSETLARLMAHLTPKITTEFIHRIRFYAPFHDIGKYRIPDEVLFSNKIFTQEERDIMNMHPIYGEEIIDELVRVSDLNNTLVEDMLFLKNIIRFHHEAYDGSGYPDRLSQLDIPLEARIVTLADVFDALLSKRPYKEPWNISKVIHFIRDKSGTLFDPVCAKVLIDNIEDFVTIQEVICDEQPMPQEQQVRLAGYH